MDFIEHDTLVKKLRKRGVEGQIVVGYLSGLIEDYPEVFPGFMRSGKYITEFVDGRWIHRKGHIFTKQSLYENFSLSS